MFGRSTRLRARVAAAVLIRRAATLEEIERGHNIELAELAREDARRRARERDQQEYKEKMLRGGEVKGSNPRPSGGTSPK